MRVHSRRDISFVVVVAVLTVSEQSCYCTSVVVSFTVDMAGISTGDPELDGLVNQWLDWDKVIIFIEHFTEQPTGEPLSLFSFVVLKAVFSS